MDARETSQSDAEHGKGFERHALTVTLLTLISRVTGLVRDGVLSRLFGAGPLMSAFFFAFMIPNLFRRLFGEGALAAAFLPSYSRLYVSDRAASAELAKITIGLMLAGLGLLTIGGEIVLYLLQRQQSTTEQSQALQLMMIMLPYMPLVCIVAVLGAILQVRGRFGPTAAAPVVLNIAIIATAISCSFIFNSNDTADRRSHVMLIAASVVVAGVIQVVWSWLAVGDIGGIRLSFRSLSSQVQQELSRIIKVAGPMILSLGVLQLNTFLDGLLASLPVTFGTNDIFGWMLAIDEHSMAVLSYGQRLYQFPLGVFGIAVATAIFPQLAREVGDASAFRETLQRGLRLVMFVGIPASVGLMLIREPLVAVIFQGGEFTVADSKRVGSVLLGYAPAIWAYSMTHVMTRAFYARDDSRRPMQIAISIVCCNVLLNLILMHYIGEAGLAWSTAACSMIQVTLLHLAFRRHHLNQIITPSVVQSWLKILLISGIMVVILFVGLWKWWDIANTSWWQALIAVVIATAVGGAIVAGLSRILRMPELAWAIGLRK